MGRLEVITGPMYAGKSEELIRRVRRHTFAKNSVIVVKPDVDTRYSEDEIVSHNGTSLKAHILMDSASAMDWLLFETDADVYAFDEAQFYSLRHFLTLVRHLIEADKLVIVAGLDMTYRCDPFGQMHWIMAWADDVTKLSAVCHVCGQDAPLTHRIGGGTGVVEVGGTELYEARCRKCHGK